MAAQRGRKVDDPAEADTAAPEPEQEEVPPGPIAPEPDPVPEETEEPEATIGLLNPGSSSVIYNSEGQSIGAGERIGVAEIDEVGQAALDRGYLTRLETNP